MREVVSQMSREAPIFLGETPNVDAKVLQQAVNSAYDAWAKGRGDWATARMEDRVAAVTMFRDRMIEKREIVCRLLMWEIGKNWPDAQNEFDRTVQYINDTIDEVKELDRDSSRFQFAGGIMAQIRRAPLGVTLCMGPFNYPLNETFATLIPALIMGNVVVVKIARFGQLLWDPLLEAFRDCFPAGVVNIVNGLGREIISPESSRENWMCLRSSVRAESPIKSSSLIHSRIVSAASWDLMPRTPRSFSKTPIWISPFPSVSRAVFRSMASVARRLS